MRKSNSTAILWRSLRSLKLSLALFLVLAALATVGTFTAIDVYRSPLFVGLAGLLALNIAFCTVHRTHRRFCSSAGGDRLAILDLLVHLSLLVILTGGVAKGLWGFIGAQYLFVGFAEDSVRDVVRDVEAPLGFTLLLKERRDEYYPLRARIGVREKVSGRKEGLLEVVEGRPSSLGGKVTVAIEAFDQARGEVALLARIGEEEGRLLLATGETGEKEASFGPYMFVLVAYRRDLKQVRGRIAVLEDGREIKEQWLAVNSRLAHLDTSIFQTGWGTDPYRNEYITIQVSRDPGAPAFWAGCVLLGVSLPLFLLQRGRRRKKE